MEDRKRTSSDLCPICKELLPVHARGKTFHAESHGMSAESLARKISGGDPVCECGCGKNVPWKGWSAGFSRYIRGHMSNESRQRGSLKLISYLKENHWARGKTKETCEVIAQASKKISEKLKTGFSTGEINHWARGLTAAVDERIAESARKRSESLRARRHWKFMSDPELLDRIRCALGDRFEIVSGLDDISLRANNMTHHIEIMCKSCHLVTSPSVYGIIRYENKTCLSCRTQFSSEPQSQIEEFVRSLVGDNCVVLTSDRTNLTGYELDVYVPSASLAIEFNGLYWHSDRVLRDKQYHNKKTSACREKGISLLHVFQDEWRDKKKIVESMIINRLHLSDRIWARQCKIVELCAQESKRFFDNNHIDGDTKGFKTYAMVHEGRIVSAIKIRRPHSKKWRGCLEVARYACSLGIDVVGGHSRLISHVRKNHPERLVTYVDTRFGGTGRHCIAAGMVLDSISEHSFWWTDREFRYNRLYCKAKPGVSESEEANNRKLLKIWGCSNLVFTT